MSAEDIVPLVSFPRSGNTWLRFLLANCLKKDASLAIDYRMLDRLTPTAFDRRVVDLDVIRAMLIPGSPLLIKEHLAYQDMPGYEFSRAIYIYRERADALRSYWSFVEKRTPGLYPNIETFLRYYGYLYRTWEEHVRSWLDARENVRKHRILVLRYEDLASDTERTLTRAVEFLGCDVPPDRVRAAVEESSYDKIRKLSSEGFPGGNVIPRSQIDRSVFESRRECGNRLRLHAAGALYTNRWRVRKMIRRFVFE